MGSGLRINLDLVVTILDRGNQIELHLVDGTTKTITNPVQLEKFRAKVIIDG